MWRVVKMDGTVFFSDTPNHRGYRMISKSWKAWAEKSSESIIQRRKKFDPFVQQSAKEFGLNPELIHAIILTESAYRAEVVSHAGATGLMQLMPETAKRFGVKALTDPQQNIRGGCAYLKTLFERFDENLTLVLAAYNAGENAVIRYDNTIPPYPETQNYVKKVFAHFDSSKHGVAYTANTQSVKAANTPTTPEKQLVADTAAHAERSLENKTDQHHDIQIQPKILSVDELLIKDIPTDSNVIHSPGVLKALDPVVDQTISQQVENRDSGQS